MGRKDNAPTGKTPQVSDAEIRRVEEQLEAAHEATRRMDVSSRIIYYDKQQAFFKPITVTRPVDPALPDGDQETITLEPTAVFCGADRKHGPLQVHGSGAMMICQQRAPGDRNSFCSYTMPLSV